MEISTDNPMWGSSLNHRDDDNALDCALSCLNQATSASAVVDTDCCWGAGNDSSCLSFGDFFSSGSLLVENEADSNAPSASAQLTASIAANLHDSPHQTAAVRTAARLPSCVQPAAMSFSVGSNNNSYSAKVDSTNFTAGHFSTIGATSSGQQRRTPTTKTHRNHNDVSVRKNDAVVSKNGAAKKSAVHSSQKTFSCDHCEAKFTRSHSLKKHVLGKHAALPPLKHCPFLGCAYATRMSNLMGLHKKGHQKGTVYFCKQCKVKYSLRASLLQHLTQKHQSNTALIGIIFVTTQPTAANSEDENEAEQIFELTDESSSKIESTVREVASNSKKKFSTSAASGTASSNGKQQPKFVDSSPSYLCAKCDYSSNSFPDIYRHRQTAHYKSSAHSGVDRDRNNQPSSNICLYCFQKFASSNSLLTHIKKKHMQAVKSMGAAKKIFACGKCSFTTTRKKVLKAHEDNSRHGGYAMHEKILSSKDDHFSQRKSGECVISSNGGHTNYTPRSSSLIGCGKDSGFMDGVPLSTGSSWGSRNANVEHGVDNTFAQSADEVGGVFQRVRLNNQSQHATCVLNDNVKPMNRMGVASYENRRVIDQQEKQYDDIGLFDQSESGMGEVENFVADPSRCVDDCFEDMAACVQNLQSANGNLLRLCRRRSDQLKSLRHNVLELLKRVHPSSECFNLARRGPAALEDVDGLVIDAINSGFRSN